MEKELVKEILKKVRKLEITTKKLVDENLSGHYHSAFKGQGMNFSEIREYVSGDDIRRIDWNVTARQGHPFIKQYNEERERTILLAIDVSSSNLFGSIKTKKELISELASVLAFSAEKNKDKVGLLLFSTTIELFIPPVKGRTHLLRIIRELLFFKPKKKGTDYLNLLHFLNSTFHKKITIFMVSDFGMDVIPIDFKKKLKRSGMHHDLIAIRVRDKNEIDLPQIGIISLWDLETGATTEINTNSKRTLKKYKQMILERDNSVQDIFKSSGIDFLDIFTDEDYIKLLLGFFIKRERRY